MRGLVLLILFDQDITSMKQYIEFVHQCGNLKHLERGGWVQFNEECDRQGHPEYKIPRPESVASHIFRAALLALSMPLPDAIDRNKLMRLLLVHDLPESDLSVGDITPRDKVPRDEKERRERAAVEQLCTLIPSGEEIRSLWEEYQANQTPEAHIAHDLDKIEWAVQVREYEHMKGMRFPGYIEWAAFRIQTETGQQIFDLLLHEVPTNVENC